MIPSNIELFGRKTFFIAPDPSLIPKGYLEEFMARGYQTYIINDDYVCPLQVKIREIIKLFPESILFFNIDSSVEGIEWKSYLNELQKIISNDTLLGVFYISRRNPSDEESVNSYYINNLHLKAGCFALSAHNHNDFDSILKVLEKNGAKGRRNLVRASCDSSSHAKFSHKGKSFDASLLDVNVSYFRCDLHGEADSFKIFDKVRDVSVQVNGITFASDAVLIMKRTVDEKTLCIFMFIKADDTPDLDGETAKLLNQKIYQIALDDNMSQLQSALKSAV